jgi:hypothetical protein
MRWPFKVPTGGLRSGAILPASRARGQPTESAAGDPAPRNVVAPGYLKPPSLAPISMGA